VDDLSGYREEEEEEEEKSGSSEWAKGECLFGGLRR
jgi:hypothetical protein